ncbi:hypothetical protein [Salibacterium aidingense]
MKITPKVVDTSHYYGGRMARLRGSPYLEGSRFPLRIYERNI